MSKCGHNMALELTAPHLLKRVGARRSRCGARQVGAATQLDVMWSSKIVFLLIVFVYPSKALD
jgi:hypothetical protein